MLLMPLDSYTGSGTGFTIFFSLVGHIFDDSIRIYAFPNSGGWYDFGFFLGVCVLLGGAAAAETHDEESEEQQ